MEYEQTPNPNALKFLCGKIKFSGDKKFIHEEDLKPEGTIQTLFMVSGIKSVYIGVNFVTVTKHEYAVWSDMIESIISVLDVAEKDVESVGVKPEAATETDDEEIAARINEILDARVRPYVETHGGNIVLKSFRNGIAFVEMEGSCGGCPSSTYTLKMGIENMLKHFIPEVIEVVQV